MLELFFPLHQLQEVVLELQQVVVFEREVPEPPPLQQVELKAVPHIFFYIIKC